MVDSLYIRNDILVDYYQKKNVLFHSFSVFTLNLILHILYIINLFIKQKNLTIKIFKE